jgi:hypothetical protein
LIAILTILVSFITLGEQIGIYFVQQGQEFADKKTKQLLYIVIALSSVNVINAIFKSELIRMGISFLYDVGELITYLGLFDRTPALLGVAITLSVVKLVFRCIIITSTICLPKQEPPKKKPPKKPWNFWVKPRYTELSVQIVFFGLANGLQLMTLFITPPSRFSEIFYEILFIIYMWFGIDGGEFITEFISDTNLTFRDIFCLLKYHFKVFMHLDGSNNSKPCSPIHSEEYMKDSSHILKRWLYLKFVCFLEFNLLFMAILMMVVSILEFEENGDQISNYEQFAYIVFIVINAIALVLYQVFFLAFVVINIRRDDNKPASKELGKIISIMKQLSSISAERDAIIRALENVKLKLDVSD